MKISALASFKTRLLTFALLTLAFAPAALAQFSIDAVPIPDAVIGAPYPAVNLTTTGGFGPINWSISGSPVPPAGFAVGQASFASTTGIFCWGAPAGNPICGGTVNAIAGSYLFTVHAQDSRLQVAERQFIIRIQQQLAITPLSIPDVPTNTGYAQQLTAVSGTGNYLWSITSGALPVGINLDPTSGRISGTAPSTAGSYAFTVRLSDVTSGFTASRSYTFNVTSGLQITTDAVLPLATVNTVMLPVQFTATGGTGLVWAVQFGSVLPAGLALSTAGVLSGTPTATGVAHFTIQVTDTNVSVSTQKDFTLSITNGALRIIEDQLPPAEFNTPYQTTLTPAGGLPPYTFSFGPLDTHGITINSGGTISGSPTSLNTISVPVNLTDSTSAAVSKNYNLQVFPQLVLTTTSVPNGAVGSSYSLPLAATGGQVPYHWSLVLANSLPAGITLNANTGTLEGTPANLGTSIFTVKVTDNAGYTSTRLLTLTIGTGVIISTSSLPNGIVSQAYSQQLAATGGALPLSWTVTSGSLPAGLSIDAGTGLISGTPTATGASQFTIRVTDAASNSNERTFTVNIAASLSITTTQLSSGAKGLFYSFSLQSSGGRSPYTWSLGSGNLPAGLSLDSRNGLISGTPTATGTFTFGINLVDGGSQSTTATLSISIGDGLNITTGDLSFSLNQPVSVTFAAQGTPFFNWSVSSGTLPAGLALNSSTGQLTGTPPVPGMTSVTIQVTDGSGQSATKVINITVGFPSIPTLSITLPDNLQPAQQPQFTVSIPTAFPGSLQGNVTLTFASAVGGDDDTVRFATGSRTIPFMIAEGSTQVTFTGSPVIVTGTTAGTLTLTISSVTAVKNGLQQTVTLTTSAVKTATIARSVAAITSISLERSTNAINVIITGYSPTHEIASGAFHFDVAQGSTVAQSDLTVQLSSVFTTWFQSAASTATGGQFRLVVPFAIQGDSNAITLVRVTLTNGQGISASAASQ